MFLLVLAGLPGYFLGSFPTAYLLVRWKSGLDIRSAGSGNVGMLNSYLVTRSVPLGAVVLLADAAKGAAAVAVARWVTSGDFTGGMVGLVAAILGHNFPVWLGFRGGRGLATAAGAFGLIAWPVVGVWCALWCAAFALVREVTLANTAASTALPVMLWTVPDAWIACVAGGVPAIGPFRTLGTAALALILVKHLGPLMAYIRERRSARGRPGANNSGRP